jgi:acetyltransferase-like isoleucine patch superfamily enzyme
MSNFLNSQEIKGIGFQEFGKNLLISRDAKFYNTSNISLGSNIRIDDFCILSAGKGGIQIASYVHIACFTSLIGRAPIKIGKFSNLSSRVSIYSSSDDYSGRTMTNPMVPEELKNVQSAQVIIDEHVIIGCNATVLPGVSVHKGVAIGAYSLIKSDCKEFKLYAGIPAKAIKERKKDLISLSCEL